ncbi:MAG: Imm17 family immunity protein [Methanobrevibacter sp.]|nr:Imm17 family immunity protein [Methanobrevibacter sp.]
MIDEIIEFFSEQPQYFGIIFVCFGILMICAGIKNWGWFFIGNNYDLNKIEGINNFFGRKIARIVTVFSGIVVVIAGIVWYWIYAFYVI